jgi:hypothetical protein
MCFRIAVAVLVAPLLAVAVVGPRLSAQPAIAVHAAFESPAKSAPDAVLVEQTSDGDGDVRARNQDTPASQFAGPGPGWG